MGIPIHFQHKSEHRQDPFCTHFGTCGGCKWQHLSYGAQLTFKQEHVEANLRKLSKATLPKIGDILPSHNSRYYRNKLEFTFSDKKWLTKDELISNATINRNALGFHIPKMFDKILNIEHCYLQGEPSNTIRNAVKEYADTQNLEFYNLKTHQGFLRNLTIRVTSIGQVMVILQVAKEEKATILKIMDFLKGKFPSITSLNYVVNTKANDTFHDLPVRNCFGTAFIEEKMGGLTFRIGPKSFFQTNSEQAYHLYRTTLDYAALRGDEVVYDLYTGIGTIANFMARHCGKVVGIESIPDAVKDARKNSEINGIHNTTFYAGDMKDLLNKAFVEKNGEPSTVIIDPPRAGMHKNVIRCLNNLCPDKIVYVSCNPATQARDINDLSDNYNVAKVQPVDMFPHTHHVECVILLELRK